MIMEFTYEHTCSKCGHSEEGEAYFDAEDFRSDRD
jgi:hypothetical protein